MPAEDASIFPNGRRLAITARRVIYWQLAKANGKRSLFSPAALFLVIFLRAITHLPPARSRTPRTENRTLGGLCQGQRNRLTVNGNLINHENR